MSIEDLRQEIDSIDKQISKLFERRMDCAEQIGIIKSKENLLVTDESREKLVLQNAKENCGKYPDKVETLFTMIIKLCKQVQ